MAQVLARATRIPRLGRFGWLMALYAENLRKLVRLLAPGDLAVGAYVSSIGDGLDLRLDVLEQHRYTSELRLTYAMVDAAPDADLLLLDLNMPDVQGFPHWRACARNTRSFRR